MSKQWAIWSAIALAAAAGGSSAIAQEKIKPTGPIDVAQGLLTDTASPESKAR